MLWKAIQEQAEIEKGSIVSYPKRRFNEGKHLLANMYRTACRTAITQYTVQDTAIDYDLPQNCKYIIEVIDSNNCKDVVYSADTARGIIRFNYKETYSVVCAFETDNIAGSDGETPQINAAYHYALAKFIASKELAYSRPQQSKALYQEFLSEAEMADRSLSRGRMDRVVMKARRVL